MRLLEARVAIVSGAGRGIGRAHAMMLASHGAAVVVNDVGGTTGGEGVDLAPADAVVAEIEALGGRAVANGGNVADWAAAEELVEQAVGIFGGLDIVVNNAGISRDRMAYKMNEDEWDAVIDVHLKGTFAVSRFAAAYWRQRAKQTSQLVNASIVNTSSASGLFGSLGQVNYVAAKAGVAAMTVSMARELQAFGVRVNAVAPVAATRLLALVVPDLPQVPQDAHDPLGPDQIAPLVAWLCTDDALGVSGQVFEVNGSRIRLVKGWHAVTHVEAEGVDWTIERIGSLRSRILGDFDTNPGTFTIEL